MRVFPTDDWDRPLIRIRLEGTRIMKTFLRFGSAAIAMATMGLATTAHADTTADAVVTAEILTALSVDLDTTNDLMDFGTLADGGIAAATDIVMDSGANVTCAANVLCAGTPATPTFNVTGATDAIVDVSFVNATETLTHTGGDQLTVKDFTASANQVTLTGGSASFAVGGTLELQPGQTAGVYNGTVSVSVAYN